MLLYFFFNFLLFLTLYIINAISSLFKCFVLESGNQQIVNVLFSISMLAIGELMSQNLKKKNTKKQKIKTLRAFPSRVLKNLAFRI